MLQFVRLLCKHSQNVKFLNCGSRDPQTNIGAQEGVQSLTQKYIGNMFKNLLLKNYIATVCEITMQASLAIVDSKLVKT